MGFLAHRNFPITQSMLHTINEIINCPWKDQFRQLFLEGKVLELLLMQLDQISPDDTGASKGLHSRTIIEKMHQARNIILNQLNNPMCLSDLAKAVNTNEYTLKKEFKNIFGTTVFGYIRDVQMERAKGLLLNQSLSVNEVSCKVGYKNPQHFSVAFKRKFGINPSQIKHKSPRD